MLSEVLKEKEMYTRDYKQSSHTVRTAAMNDELLNRNFKTIEGMHSTFVNIYRAGYQKGK